MTTTMLAPPSTIRNAAYWGAVVVAAFNALSAIGGGIGMLATDGLGMPLTALSGGPFTSFVIPAAILIVVVGGTQTIAAVLLVARREIALLWSAVAGFGMLIWIFIETIIIRGGSWLQVLYFTTGTAQLALVFALLGLASWLPRAPLRRAAVETDVVTNGGTHHG